MQTPVVTFLVNVDCKRNLKVENLKGFDNSNNKTNQIA